MTRTLAALTLVASVLAGWPGLAAERTVTLAVDNMSCESCPYIVKQSLARVDGVSQVAVSLEKKTATVTYDDRKTTLVALTNATTEAGYPSKAIP